MSESNRWLLPDGVDELLPPEARKVEQLRRAALDLYSSYGYELVSPPLIEYLESLLTGTGNDLDLQTFKVTDQLTGRLMGVRADITPQVARIDSHFLKREGLSRLCYADTVLNTRPAHMLTNRSPLQLGCELFGESGSAADIEIICLMLETLQLAGIEDIHIDLAHVGVFGGLVQNSGLDEQSKAALFDALGRKSIPDMQALAKSSNSDSDVITKVLEIAQLSGGVEALEALSKYASDLGLAEDHCVNLAIAELEAVLTGVQKRYPSIEIGFDFCELRGYAYHTGVMFAAYTPSHGYALAKGGRYNDIGKDFGVSRPATGFSADLKTLVRLPGQDSTSNTGILAPAVEDVSLDEAIKTLRQSEKVVQLFSDSDEHLYGCDRRLVLEAGTWIVKPI